MLRSALARYETKELVNIPELLQLLSVKNPAHVQWARWGTYYAEEPEEFILCYQQSGKYYWLPRNTEQLFPQYFDLSVPDYLRCGVILHSAPLDITFTGNLRAYQDKFVKGIDWCKESDLLLEVPTGHGKSVLGVFATCTRQCTTLVLVPTYEIGQQWHDAYLHFSDIDPIDVWMPTPQTVMCQLDNPPGVLILTYDLFYARQDVFTEAFMQHWGLVIMDEAHRVGAETYQPVLGIIPSRYRLALTATFRRADGMAKILAMHFGKHYQLTNQHPEPICYPVKTDCKVDFLYDLTTVPGGKKNHAKNRVFLEQMLPLIGVNYYIDRGQWLLIDLPVAQVAIHEDDFGSRNNLTGEEWVMLKKIFEHIHGRQGQGINLMDSYVSELNWRNGLLLHAVRECINAGRTVVFISKRKEALKQFHAQFQKEGYDSCIILGDKKWNNLADKKATAQVFWGIQQKAKEGLDIERADTLVLHQPLGDIEQAAGRINRIASGKREPLVLYPWDEYNPYKFLYGAAKRKSRNVLFIKQPVSVDYFLYRATNGKNATQNKAICGAKSVQNVANPCEGGDRRNLSLGALMALGLIGRVSLVN